MSLFLGREAGSRADYTLEPEKLRTHGVVVGMTGSGKTGMALVMLEELVQAGIPILAIDPKGDLGNLGLVFPELRPADFAPWTDGADADEVARRWRDGLTAWGQTGRMAALRERMALTLYTPGSEAGVAVDVLGSLRRPDERLLADDEGRLALVSDTVSGLLGLVGHAGDPVRDPAHIVLATILDAAWMAGEDPDLEVLLTRLMDPPFKKVGVFPVDRFFPPDDRADLAMKLNGVIASPSFQAWTRGASLDLDAMLKPTDRVPVSVFCLAHLSDDERQFFLSLLLGRLLAWTRGQPGTERLRAVLFFDEVAGYFPPHPKDPPTKRPLLLLMKQARAMGLGVVLATQNPVDVDYKGLSNAGLWCVGRLRTDQDRERVLQGMSGEGLDAAIAGLQKRQFLFALASGETQVVETRQAMCYLRGPFTKSEISALRASDAHSEVAAPARPTKARRVVVDEAPEEEEAAASAPPAELPQRWLKPSAVFAARLGVDLQAHAEPPRADGLLLHRPALYAHLALRFDEEAADFVQDVERHRLWFPLGDGLPDEPVDLDLRPADLADAGPERARYAPLPTWLDEKKELAAIQKRVLDEVYRSETTGLFTCPPLKLWSRADEDEARFRHRCEDAVNDRVDDRVAELREDWKDKADKLDDRLRKAEAKLAEAERNASARQTEEIVNVGETLLSWFTGRRKSLGTAATRRRQSSQASERVQSLHDDVEALREELEGLEASLVEEMEAVRTKESKALAAIEERQVGLEKADVSVRFFGLLWIPVTRRL